MLRVGLTGGLGSGKSTAAALFHAHGAHVLSSDEIGRELMQPGQPVFNAIVSAFGFSVVLPGGRLNRPALATAAFTEGRLEELNAIVHPAVIDRQAELVNQLGARDPHAVVIVESALIFETTYGGNAGWQQRFNKLVLVTAPEELRIARFVDRSARGIALSDTDRSNLEEEAHRRIARQLPDEQKAALCDYVLTNAGPFTELEWQVDRLWPLLLAMAV